jgi:hypothetical protein
MLLMTYSLMLYSVAANDTMAYSNAANDNTAMPLTTTQQCR